MFFVIYCRIKSDKGKTRKLLPSFHAVIQLGVCARLLETLSQSLATERTLGLESPAVNKKRGSRNFLVFVVIRLGFEPKTPTLKVLCSTD